MRLTEKQFEIEIPLSSLKIDLTKPKAYGRPLSTILMVMIITCILLADFSSTDHKNIYTDFVSNGKVMRKRKNSEGILACVSVIQFFTYSFVLESR